MIYFTSDLHFFHANAIQYCRRPFSDVEEMNRTLIANWNQTVSAEDEVYILGDFTLKGSSYANGLLRQLAGRKYLIKGNHDRFTDQETFEQSAFLWVKDYYELHCGGMWFILCHYPLKSWNHQLQGSIHLHGHEHNPPPTTIARTPTPQSAVSMWGWTQTVCAR